jgi:hypothetical protein
VEWYGRDPNAGDPLLLATERLYEQPLTRSEVVLDEAQADPGLLCHIGQARTVDASAADYGHGRIQDQRSAIDVLILGEGHRRRL